MWLSLYEIQLSFRTKFKTDIRQSCDTRISSQTSSSALWHYKQIISSRCQRFKLIYDIGNNFPCSDPRINRQIADTLKKNMPKHHWREPFKSFLGREIDHEKAVELRGTKEEIDRKVQTILELLKEDDNDGKESLAEMIQDFHSHYQSLYESYDHLTEELRNKAQGKHGKDSSSSSSDSSDSDDSPRKNGTKYGKVDNKIVNSSAEIKQELGVANLEVGELKKKLAVTIQELEKARIVHAEQNQKLEDMDRERESLIFEKEAIAVTFEEEKRSAEESRAINSELQQDKDTLLLELGAVKREFDTLKEKLETGENEIAKLIQVQKTAEEENTMLSLNISRLEDEIKQAEKKIQDLVTESCHLSEKVADKEKELSSHLEIHEAHKEEASTRMKDLKVNLDTSHTQRREIEKQKDDELSVLLKKLEDQESGSLDLEKKISDLEKTLAEREDELISIQEKLEDVQIEASTQIAALTEHVYSFQQQLELQQFENTQLELQIKRGKLESTENLSLVENINSELVNKVIQEENKLKEKENAFIKLSEEHKQLELQYQNLEESLKSSQKKIKELTEQLHKERDTENQELVQLEETVEDLKRDLEMKDDEISTLKEIMRNTEVKHRLTRQKLHITEQLLAEKEEIQLSKEMKLREEQKSLEERITILSGTVTTYKEAQVKMITEVSEKVNDTLTGIDTFNMKFEEDYGHLETRIYEIVNELKLTRNWITETKKESTRLLQRLKDKNEQDVLMSVKIGEMETKLRNDKDERERLIQTVKRWEGKMAELEKVIEEKDEKTGELERKMNEKDKGLLSLSEEKREAIRQLCVWIDYHRNRYNDLKDMIAKTTGGRRPVAT